ncbi:MAG TPA: serine/threonine-protein kinase [Urbifossiella sp.]|nr:serine/threonine-protein kinase [Urbifossiella sp.]
MAENETVTDSGSEPSAVAWVGKLLKSDRPARTPTGEPATRSLRGSASTGLQSTDLSIAPFRIGPYEVLEKIGEGGMGFVFRVRNTELQRIEALKLIAPRNSDDSTSRARFEREFLAQAKIEHHNIVPVYAAGTWDGQPYFTMKYVAAGALNKHLDRFLADATAAAALMAKVARAVHRLHADKILHRDLKPHNILLDDGDEPLVADFGLVKNLDENSDASVTGAPMGTRQYMSPEQTFAHRTDYTPACDVWAIGVILYELLAGVRPFPGSDPVDLYLQIREANPTPLLEVNPAAPPPLAAVAHRCLAKAPADRYPTAAAVADDLEAWLAGDAVTATLPPPRRVPRSRWREWAAGAAATAAVAAAVAFALTGPPSPGNGGEGGPTPPPDAGTQPPEHAGPAVAPMPSRARTVAERLAAGDTVTLIGPKGLPTRPWRQLPGSTADLTFTEKGECVMPAFEFAAVELLNESLPLPVIVSAEIDLGSTIGRGSWGGIYAGGTSWDGNGFRFQTTPAVTIMSDAPVEVDGEMLIATHTSADVFGWTATHAGGRLTIGSFPPSVQRYPIGKTAPHNWQPVLLVLHADGVDVGRAGHPARRLDWAEKVVRPGRVNFAGNRPAADAWVPPPPIPGNGIGLVAVQSRLSVRNLTVSKP